MEKYEDLEVMIDGLSDQVKNLQEVLDFEGRIESTSTETLNSAKSYSDAVVTELKTYVDEQGSSLSEQINTLEESKLSIEDAMWEFVTKISFSSSLSRLDITSISIDLDIYDYYFEINLITSASTSNDVWGFLNSSNEPISFNTNWISSRVVSSSTGSESAPFGGWAFTGNSTYINGIDGISSANALIRLKVMLHKETVMDAVSFELSDICTVPSSFMFYRNTGYMYNFDINTIQGIYYQLNSSSTSTPINNSEFILYRKIRH